jgi:hypothetical protein
MRKSLENMVRSMQGRAFIRPDRLERPLLAKVFDVGSLQRNHTLSSQKYNRPMGCSKNLLGTSSRSKVRVWGNQETLRRHSTRSLSTDVSERDFD